jgi:HSP20 family protein
MSLVRFDPFRELENIQSRLNRFFNDMPARTADEDMFFTDWAPAVDIQENEKEYLVKADLPEVKKDDLKVEVENGVLNVEGERKREKEEKGKTFHRVERSYGKFIRRFALPTEVDAAQVKAEFKDGVLAVHLPKTVVAKPKSVEVKVA